jgi:hypothetical protein
MVTNKTLLALRRIESSLRAVADIPVPGTGSTVGATMHDLTLNITGFAPNQGNLVIQDLQRANTIFSGRIWVNTDHFHATDQTVTLNSLITTQKVSNGKQCFIVVLHSTMTDKRGADVSIALKCRHVSRSYGNEHFTQREGTNILALDSNPATRGLFPSLMCIASFQTTYTQNNRQVCARWEAIGTELLQRIPNFQAEDVYPQCFARLKALHAAGYMHGDPHIGNFMVHPTRGILMIDQDEVRELPSEQVASKYFQILDYLELLYWFNPSCVVFGDGDTQRMYQVFMQTADFVIAFPPYGFLCHRGSDVPTVLRDLQRPSKHRKTYIQFLGETPVATIDDYFENIFASTANMKTLEAEATDLHAAFTNAASQSGRGPPGP